MDISGPPAGIGVQLVSGVSTRWQFKTLGQSSSVDKFENLCAGDVQRTMLYAHSFGSVVFVAFVVHSLTYCS